MESQGDFKNCQLPGIPNFSEGYAEVPPESLKRKLRLLVRRSLNVRQVRFIKTKTSHILDKVVTMVSKRKSISEVPMTSPKLQAGDLVLVRPEAEIRATLNPWGILKGCMFMPEMLPYCGTTQRVFKRMERFMDERDYHVKKSSGIILLEGLHCQGTSDYGRCDRSCFYFWREEWLEKIDTDATPTGPLA